MDSYKHLEKLCGEVMGDARCISAYIDEMVNTPGGSRLVRSWENDLKQLKHYRWVRNQIVHDPLCTEENMCGEEDTIWLESFYSRIMSRTDLLALYYKATKPAAVHKPPQAKTSVQQPPCPQTDHSSPPKNPHITAVVIAILIFVIFTVAVILGLEYR